MSVEPSPGDRDERVSTQPSGSTPPGPIFLAITGPTASGKSRLSLEVARRLHGEIVSMDSRQVYRGMDVGTAKITLAERAEVPHHGLDLLDPDQTYSAGAFARDARRWIREIRGRGRTPVLVGGTGFFLSALLEPFFREPPVNEERVARLREHLGAYDRESLASWVRRLDPDRAEVAEEGGRQRLTRTLEVALLTGRPLSWWHREAEGEGEGLSGVIVCLDVPRNRLDRRIRERAERMVENGLVEEVRRLLDAGYDPGDPGMSGVGYAEVVEYLRGARELDDVVDRIEVRTRQYSRRQLTWFRNQLPAGTVRIDGEESLDNQATRVVEAWTTNSGEESWPSDGGGEIMAGHGEMG